MNTLLSNLENQTVFTHEWLSKMEGNGNYIISIRDNGNEFLWGTRSREPEKKILTDAGWDYFDSHFEVDADYPQSPSFSTHFSTFEFKFSALENYYGCAAVSIRPNGMLSILILKPLAELNSRILEQRILFLSLMAIGSVLLFFFSRYFTGRLLIPVEKSRQNQMAFVASASHELRTPLSVILSAANACQRAEKPEQNHFFSIIREEGEGMSRLISDLLLLAEAEQQGTNPLSVIKDLCEPDTLLLTVYESYETLAKEKGCLLAVRLPETPTQPVLCDSGRIRQVFSILLHNAFSYTPAGTQITLTLEQRDGQTVFQVCDNGPGIPDEQKGKIFDRFFRGDPSRQKNGHFGLGLSIASEIMLAHGGNIRVKDAPGGGAVFVFSLPE